MIVVTLKDLEAAYGIEKVLDEMMEKLNMLLSMLGWLPRYTYQCHETHTHTCVLDGKT